MSKHDIPRTPHGDELARGIAELGQRLAALESAVSQNSLVTISTDAPQVNEVPVSYSIRVERIGKLLRELDQRLTLITNKV